MACFTIALCANRAEAIDPDRRMSQYVLDQWGPNRGLPAAPVYALAQSSDGYLWVGAEGGLARFDGLTFEGAAPRADSTAPVMGLTADRQNGVWVRLRGLRLRYEGPRNFPDLLSGLQPPAVGITSILQTDGGLLLATPWSGLKLLRGPQLEALAINGRLPQSPVISIAKTSEGEVWLGTRDQGLVHVRGGEVTTVTKGLPDLTVYSLLPVGGGELLIGTGTGIARWNGTEVVRGGAFATTERVQALAMIQDREGNVWVAAGERGLMRINTQGVATLPARKGVAANAVLEDRDGNIWAGMSDRLERLRDSVFATYSTSEGLPSETNGPLYADAQGRVWFAPTGGGLYVLENGIAASAGVAGLDSDVVYSIAGSHGAGGDLWIGRQRGGLTHLWRKGGAFSAKTYTQADGLAQDHVFAVTESRDGSIWAGTLSGGVSHLLDGKFTTYQAADGLASNTVASILESADGTMWFATPGGLNALAKNVWRTYTARDGLPSENVNCLLEDSTGMLWAGTLGGLAMKGGTGFQVPKGAPDALRQQVLGIAEDSNGTLWITTAGHVISVKSAELRAAVRPVDFREYQLTDGLQSLEGVKRQHSVVFDDRGRIWLSMAKGLSVVNTARLAERSVPALVHIESISADGKAIEMGGEIPAGTQRVELAYAGLSLSMPERTRFRSLLEGVDHGWSEPAAARQVIYSNLGPGSYRFRVMASNVDGVFNSNEASIAFRVAPLFWQRWAVRGAAAFAVALTLVMLVRMRMQNVARQMNLRFEERLSERARIAGELHDTLLQTVQASKMIADNARLNHSGDAERMREAVDHVSTWLAQATSEGRAALQALRSSGDQKNDLAQAFQRAAEIAKVTARMALRLSVEGSERELHPLVRDEVYRIGCEAIRNAYLHSGGSQLEVTLRYTRNFILNVADNGKGMSAEVASGGKPGHFGLQGMQERAIRIHGALRLLSRPEAGTEVELTVPGKVIYAQFDREERGLYTKVRGYWNRKERGR